MTHVTTAGYGAVVAYRWHPWFEWTIEVREVIARDAEVVARCRLDGTPDGAVQELPTWMLDAGVCETMMRSASAPRLGVVPARPEGASVGGDDQFCL